MSSLLPAQPTPGERELARRIQRLEEVTAHSPRDVGSWHDLAGLHAEAGDWDQVIAAETRAVEGHPRYAVAWHGRGRARMEKRDYAAARADLTQAIALWEKKGGMELYLTVETPPEAYIDSYRSRAISWAHEGNRTAALDDFGKALRLRPDDSKMRMERASLAQKAGHTAQAIADYHRAGVLYAEGGATRQANECADRLVSLGAPAQADAIRQRLRPRRSGAELP